MSINFSGKHAALRREQARGDAESGAQCATAPAQTRYQLRAGNAVRSVDFEKKGKQKTLNVKNVETILFPNFDAKEVKQWLQIE